MSNLISSVIVLGLCALVAMFFLKLLRAGGREKPKSNHSGTRLPSELELQQLEVVDAINNVFRVVGVVTIEQLPPDGVTIGRPGGEADVRLPKNTRVSNSVSSVHFRLLQDEQGYYIQDEGSKYGLSIIKNGTEQKVDALSIDDDDSVFYAGYQPLRLVHTGGLLDYYAENRTQRAEQEPAPAGRHRRPASISGNGETQRYFAEKRPPFRGGDYT